MEQKVIVLHKLGAKPRTIMHGDQAVDSESSAFIGATDGGLCQFGIGLLDANNQSLNRFWALAHPHRLITAWRGMFILDAADIILSDTLYQAYHAGSDDDKDFEAELAAENLAKYIPDMKKLRQNILKRKISEDTLNAMLKICNDPANDIHIDLREIEEAISKGIIKRTAEVTHAYQAVAAEKEKRNVIGRSASSLYRNQRVFVSSVKNAISIISMMIHPITTLRIGRSNR